MKIYEFETTDCTLDGTDGALRTPNGALVDLRPQTREVLRLLAMSPNRTIEKAEFAEQVWEGRTVGTDSLVQCIAEIRGALGDTDRKVIQTVPRKGYRFVPPSTAVTPTDTPKRILPLLLAVVLLCAGVLGMAFYPEDNSHARAPVLAVLPLEDLSPEPLQGYLSDALVEGIITELARFPQFRVVARNSSFQFRETPTDVREIGRVLGAGYVLEGSQQYDGQRLRVTIQLIETGTGAHILSDQYERDLDDLFVVQNEIVRHVASVVGETVMIDLPDRTGAGGVDSLLRGMQARKLMSQLSREHWEQAIALERTSIREEPESEWGYIGTSLMLGTASHMGWMTPMDDVLDEAEELAEIAMRKNPRNYMSHYTLARVLSRRGHHVEAIEHYKRAAELNPSDSLVLIAMSIPLVYEGRADEGIEALERAKRVDPLHGDWLRWQMGWSYWQSGDCEAGLEAMLSMSSPPPPSNKALAALLICLGRTDEARDAMARFLAVEPGHTLKVEVTRIAPNWKPEGTAERWLDVMREAGMPEG
ncbi:TolB amino-terminal domain-containing protein [Mameliella alba]|uniref:winged helix-turn-helix domain-containing tetratricopeptide repeat protein n=1 Tax=Mameliella alba TaxID=561184 RepID=UPI0008872EEF|nr:tetratricopeptide repeat protein [Mameliella alba]OWV48603.1 hypothetical protein CDZ96_08300 [Mameliella alba]PTR39155.1 TolB-like protein [Mameliella alba]GGF63662.1 hypothetical protein GCM10011319_25820 [Mameliella alba]SDD24585.1 TolB amino-terminal domain-containing protein [Mameliella alba]